MRIVLHALLVFVITAALLWGAGLLWFIQTIPDHVKDETTVTDGIVALTGGSNRIAEAVALLKAEKAKKLLITGVGEGITIDNLGILDNVPQGDILYNKGRIVLGYIAKDTRQNAQETAIWTSMEGFKTIRIVTANYHIPRSILEFKEVMPDITIIPHPVFPSRVKVKEWWLFPGSTRLIISEYNKYLGSYTQHYLFHSMRSLSHWLKERLKTLDTPQM